MRPNPIAFATCNQVAFAIEATAIVVAMDEKAIQAWRAKRLEAMVDREGGKAATGRKLGYRDGAFVGQMLRGERPITEKTVMFVHSLPGYAGWFDAPTGQAPMHPGAPGRSLANTEPAPTLAQALEVVLDAMAQSTAKAELKQLLPMLVETNAAAYRARLGELLGQSLQKQPSIADKLLAIPSEVESPRLSQRATEK